MLRVPTASEYQQALELVGNTAVTNAARAAGVATDVDSLIDLVVPLIAYYSEGSAALAADHYDEERSVSSARLAFSASPVVNDREAKIIRGIQWAAPSLYGEFPDTDLGVERLGQVVQLETTTPFRDTVLTNRQRDPSAIGWRRNPNVGACKFCRLLASNGAVYKESTARFASHSNCSCSASPVFDGYIGPEASVVQYVASQRTRTPAQRAQLRNYLASLPD